MQYQVEMVLPFKRTFVIEKFLNLDEMTRWEKGLSHIEVIEGTLFESDSKGVLVFSFGDHEMRMHMTVKHVNLPDSIDLIYEVPGVWNLCVNHFIEDNQNTRWIMDVTFTFEEHMDVPKERFIDKTTEGMMQFKTYLIETYGE